MIKSKKKVNVKNKTKKFRHLKKCSVYTDEAKRILININNLKNYNRILSKGLNK
jgi:ribosomal protein L15